MGQVGMHEMSVGWVPGSRYPGIFSPRGRQHGGALPGQGVAPLCPVSWPEGLPWGGFYPGSHAH